MRMTRLSAIAFLALELAACSSGPVGGSSGGSTDGSNAATGSGGGTAGTTLSGNGSTTGGSTTGSSSASTGSTGSSTASSSASSTGTAGSTSGSTGAIDAGYDYLPSCKGLMTRAGVPPASAPTFIDYAVVQLDWTDLETSRGAYDGGGWAEIDQALASARMKGIRLRILGGPTAPRYVKQLGHAPLSDLDAGIDCSNQGGVAVYIKQDGAGGCIPFFWIRSTDGGLDYLGAYENLMTEVARRYDGDPKFLEVVDSACMTLYAETFYRAHADKGSNARLVQAGLDFTKDLACHDEGLAIHHKLFHHTRTSLAVNNWDVVGPLPDGGDWYTSWPLARSHVDAWRDAGAFGDRGLVLQNNGFGRVETCSGNNYYCYIAATGGPDGYQTRTWARLAAYPDGGGSDVGFGEAMDTAINTLDADFIELPQGYGAVPNATLQQYDQGLEANWAACPQCH